MGRRKLHKTTLRYLEGKPPQLGQTALMLANGNKLRWYPEYEKIPTVMPWEIESLFPQACVGDMQCYPVILDGKESHRTASWIIGAVAANFSGCRTRIKLYGEDLSSAHAVEYLSFEGNDQGCKVKLAVCGGVWFHAAPFQHDEKNREKLMEQFADGFIHVYGAGSDRILI